MTDLATAEALRDIGMRESLAHAERADPDWQSVAIGYIVSYARDHMTFIAEQVREHAAEHGFTTVQPKAWGSAFSVAADRGIIKCVGFGVSKSRHCSPTRLWQSQNYWSTGHDTE